MRKTITILVSLLTIFCLTACGNSAGQAERPVQENSSPEEGTESSMEAESNAEEDIQTESSVEEDVQAERDEMQAKAQGSRVLVAYFSATNTTEGVAEHLANGLGADLYEILPEEPYTEADLNYNDNNSRTTIEMNDPAARPGISGSVEDMEQYDIVFIGYPIWWGEAPRIVNTFMESYDFSGKTIIPFCTSGGSGMGSSASNLEQLTSGAVWMEGRRLNGSDSQDAVMEWVNSLGLSLNE